MDQPGACDKCRPIYQICNQVAELSKGLELDFVYYQQGQKESQAKPVNIACVRMVCPQCGYGYIFHFESKL